MKNKILFIIFMILIMAVGVGSVVSNYDRITGYATVEKSINLDIIGSSNDDNYTLSDVNQGETKWSPKIKMQNKADVPLNVSLQALILPGSAGNESDVTSSFWNDNKNETLPEVIEVKDSVYFYVKHEFEPDAETGNYIFSINAVPS